MFGLIGERKPPEINWWTIFAAVLFVFGCGMSVGVLIERRSRDPLAWAAVVFAVIVVCYFFLSPLLQGIKDRMGPRGTHAR
jgi:CHASE2 domain-containing sensor protein